MKIALLWIGLFVFFSGVNAKLDISSDYRQSAGWREDEDYSSIERFARYLQNKAEEAEAIAEAEREKEENREDDSDLESESTSNFNPLFFYKPPENTNDATFGFPPSDPRYYSDIAVPNPVQSTNNKFPAENKRKENNSTQPVLPEKTNEALTNKEEELPSSYSAIKQTAPDRKFLEEQEKSDLFFTAVVAGCSAAAVVGVVAVGISCYRLHKNAKAAADVEYPAYGVTGPNKDISPTSGDRRLAQSAQMYHYQHQKQQIIAMESRATNERHGSISDAESDEENEEGDYTVYECPGLASTGEMEVKNPLFQDDPTPASPAKQPADSSTEKSKELPK